jgi:hypothetical protein
MPWRQLKPAKRGLALPSPEVLGELAALSVLYAISRALGPRGRRRLAQAMADLAQDWTRIDPDGDGANARADAAMAASATRFARPAAIRLLAQDLPRAPGPIDGP